MVTKTHFDLTAWKYLFTYGKDLDIYGYGNLRIGIDRESGKRVLGYVYPYKRTIANNWGIEL